MNGELRALGGIDRVLHEPNRLLLAALLYPVEGADFLYLLTQSEMTKGNLSSHLAKLEAAGYIEIVKSFRGKIPHTLVRLTGSGRAAFEQYRAQLKTIASSLDATAADVTPGEQRP